MPPLVMKSGTSHLPPTLSQSVAMETGDTRKESQSTVPSVDADESKTAKEKIRDWIQNEVMYNCLHVHVHILAKHIACTCMPKIAHCLSMSRAHKFKGLQI